MNTVFPSQFPHVLTQRLALGKITGSDAHALYDLYSDERVMKFHGRPVLGAAEETEKIIFGWRRLFATEKGIRWGIRFRGGEKIIGTIGVRCSAEHRRAETGYELAPALWNQGIMTEALGAVTDYVFTQMNFETIEANIAPGNTASQRVLEKAGFRQEAHFRSNYFYEGWWDSVVFSLSRETRR
ncbi:MAG TPA: GNAT family protein [Bacteroidia bacterium]|nr:GNAT family protein [Bacteroidia bacterium]